MIRFYALTIIVAAGIGMTSTKLALAGPLEQLSQGGPSDASFRGLWSPDPETADYPSGENVHTIFRVRYYRQEWKFKKYETFANFPEANYFLLKKKMEGYTANLSIHEIAKRPRKRDYWLP